MTREGGCCHWLSLEENRRADRPLIIERGDNLSGYCQNSRKGTKYYWPKQKSRERKNGTVPVHFL